MNAVSDAQGKANKQKAALERCHERLQANVTRLRAELALAEKTLAEFIERNIARWRKEKH
jgi:hypothetical protein